MNTTNLQILIEETVNGKKVQLIEGSGYNSGKWMILIDGVDVRGYWTAYVKGDHATRAFIRHVKALENK